MKAHLKELAVLCLVFVSLTLSAKRVAPQPVEPVVAEGVRYSAPLDDGRIGTVIATEVSTGKKLWSVEVFRISINPLREEDNQWVFVTDLRMDGDSLLVKNESGQCFRVKLETRKVRKAVCWK